MRRLRGKLVILLVMALAWPLTTTAADPFRDLDLIRPTRPMPAKDFTAPGLTGRPLRLSDFKGRVIFLNFWATWCPPCKQEMPSMERLYQRHKGRGFTILAISLDADGAAAVSPFVKTFKLTFPIGLDPQMGVADLYTVRALPSSFLIDKRGNTVAIAMGPRDWDGTAAHAVIESLLK